MSGRNRQADADLQALAAQIQEDTGCTIAEALAEAQRQRPILYVYAKRRELETKRAKEAYGEPTQQSRK